ncbi:MAG: DUF1003 domain-containing protein [Bacteroidetes bacterium]|nr:DUF1003 domain-containing protein [Bacteroidota bacterium]
MVQKNRRPAKPAQLKAVIDPDNTRRDRLGLWLSNILGSMGFLFGCAAIIALYLCWNLRLIPSLKPFDPYPFNILSIALSVFAIVLSITVLIAQKRQRKTEKIREHVEFEVNVRAESEITKVLTMLHDIQLKLGIHKHDPELEEMKDPIDLDEIHKNVGEKHDEL